ncbi:MAG: type IV conjugative transfer system protein TraE [Cellvibrionaceae bacterium]|nr:type IV conjugative transfer system protein TraE [Cellvibrionaceae bacterium]
MKMGSFIRTWEGSLVENKWNRIFNGLLVVAILLLIYMLLSKDQIVVIQPETLGTESWITKNSASESYKESWGLFLAQMTGNITPANVDFLKDRFKPLLSPAIYADVIDSFEIQAMNIKNDRVTMRFEPRFVEYEKNSDKVFVYGYSFFKGTTGKEDRTDRTYEYRIKIANYAPLIVDINTYEGLPRTENVLLRLQEQEQRNADKNKNI